MSAFDLGAIIPTTVRVFTSQLEPKGSKNNDGLRGVFDCYSVVMHVLTGLACRWPEWIEGRAPLAFSIMLVVSHECNGCHLSPGSAALKPHEESCSDDHHYIVKRTLTAYCAVAQLSDRSAHQHRHVLFMYQSVCAAV